MNNFAQMMKQAQKMQEQMAAAQNKVSEMEAEGSSGAGMVTAVVNGKGELRKLKIDQSLVDPQETEVLEDLIIAAINDAKHKVDAKSQEEMARVMGEFKLPPGVKLPF